jgi:hypothetical protein
VREKVFGPTFPILDAARYRARRHSNEKTMCSELCSRVDRPE